MNDENISEFIINAKRCLCFLKENNLLNEKAIDEISNELTKIEKKERVYVTPFFSVCDNCSRKFHRSLISLSRGYIEKYEDR